MDSLTLDQVVLHYREPISKAAVSLGVGTTTLKLICRKHGVDRWPYRKILALERKISSIDAAFPKASASRQNYLRAEREHSQSELDSIFQLPLASYEAQQRLVFSNYANKSERPHTTGYGRPPSKSPSPPHTAPASPPQYPPYNQQQSHRAHVKSTPPPQEQMYSPFHYAHVGNQGSGTYSSTLGAAAPAPPAGFLQHGQYPLPVSLKRPRERSGSDELRTQSRGTSEVPPHFFAPSYGAPGSHTHPHTHSLSFNSLPAASHNSHLYAWPPYSTSSPPHLHQPSTHSPPPLHSHLAPMPHPGSQPPPSKYRLVSPVAPVTPVAPGIAPYPDFSGYPRYSLANAGYGFSTETDPSTSSSSYHGRQNDSFSSSASPSEVRSLTPPSF
eukprot:TRINITY_DN1554_c0_g1_i1.p1 TRINITY_DN1554_c0_g1~~TRINITY_DN1554_c0_g1_i1.p1  ORF type:complete len:385 (+),score=66.87 TRINITY_DN1554_c0_g1_i1:209-1363(+)